ncbi:hypothetical protein GUITHDRAFT_147505 [Guillardia theta CCMP2712]|uniref:Uncharacterized protein n=1 Tax=Guillardia theta (strain CCMP2712) TaxID=905079 RepID=L1ID70_GUITC|nr:hypothetical protein GUITHDRAFT_147505 [Guillardia theta CCMP2712]EKX34047.1 hypothetical protein GUITHDRAFT_147505 [Guillardia theta CCMP2712]|eukprot:XP_005821027.1 hypothetical protein GUITHDRAFT_147505 [Guillardia theta CCMP2712]
MALTRVKGSARRRERPSLRPGDGGGRGEDAMSSLEAAREPTDLLSDGYESEDSNSERVIALLKSGIRARQSDNLCGARSHFARAARIQQSRGRQRSKLDLWLRSLADSWGKARVRKAALDVQRTYRGMLGREECRWIRHDRMKQQRAKTDKRQRALSIQVEAAKVAQRHVRRFLAMISFDAATQHKVKDCAASCMQGYLRRRLQKEWSSMRQDLPRWLRTFVEVRRYRKLRAASTELQSRIRRRGCASIQQICSSHSIISRYMMMLKQRSEFNAMQILGPYLVSRNARKHWCRLLQSHETIAARLVRICVQMQKERRLEALACLCSCFQRSWSVREYSKLIEQSDMTVRHNSYERIAQTVVMYRDRREFLTFRASTILLQARLRRSLEYALVCFHLVSMKTLQGEHKEMPRDVSHDECPAIQNEHEDQIEELESENSLPYQTQQLKSVFVFSFTAQELKDDDLVLLTRERERISRRMARSQGDVELLFPHELACGSPIASRLALRHLMTSKK